MFAKSLHNDSLFVGLRLESPHYTFVLHIVSTQAWDTNNYKRNFWRFLKDHYDHVKSDPL